MAEIIPSGNRSAGMSQLDWLWATYKDYNVVDELPSSASSSLILTDNAVRKLIQQASGGGITRLLLIDSQSDDGKVNLVGYDSDGVLLTLVEMPKEDHIESLSCRKVTEADGDCGYEVGTRVLAVATRLGKTYMVSCAELTDGMISSDDGNLLRKGSDGGLYASIEWGVVG